MAGMPIRSQNHPVGPSSWTALSSTLKLVMLLMSVLVLLAIPHTMAATTVYVGSSFTSNVDDVTNSMSYYVTGIIAPAALGSNSIISIAPSIISSGSAQGNGVWSAFSSQSGVVALFGPGGTQYMYSIYDNLDLFSYSFMTFAPMAQSVDDSGLTVFLNPLNQVYWTMPSEQAQSVGLLLLLMERSLFPINQLLYRTKSVGIGYTASLLYKHIMPSQVKLNSLDEPFWWKSTYESSVEAKPGVVYMFGMSEADTTTHTWVENLLVDPNLIEQNTTIVFTFEMQYFMLTQFTDLASKNTATLPVANFISSAPVPGVDSTEYAAAQDFMSQAQGIIPAGSSSCLLNYMMAGWVNGWGLVQAIHKFSGSSISDKSYFFTALIGAQFSFVVSDLFVGSMSGQGSATAANQGALTNCQHGGNNVWFHSFVKKGATYDTAPIEGQMFQYGLGLCANLIAPNDMISEIVPYQQLIKVPQAVHAMAFSTSDNPMIESMCEQMTDVVSRVGNRNLYWHESTHAYSLHCLDTVELNASADFAAFAQSYIVDALYGVIPDSLVGTSITTSNFIVDFMPQTTQPHIHQANLIYLFPTLEQELYQLTSYLGNVATTNSVVCAVTRSSATISPAIIGLLTSTLRTFGISTEAENLLQVNGAIGSSIPKSCTHTFVLGIDADDAALLVDYLTATPQAIVLTAFDDLTKFYAEIQTAMAKAPTSLTNRLLFATNLPPWTGVATAPTPADASLSSIHDFLASVPATLHTPAALRAFITAKVYDLLTSWWGADAGSSQDALYGNVSLTVDGLVFGPYRATCVLPDGESSNQGACVGNYGAQDIAVWSYTRVVAPATTPVLATATTPTLIYLSSGVQALGDHARSRPSTIEDELSRSEVGIPLAVADAHAATNCVEPFAESSAEQKHQSAASPSSASSGASGPKKSLNYAARTRMAYAAQEDAHEDDASDDTDEVLDKLSLFLFIMLGVVALALIVFGILMCGAGRHLQYLFLSCCGGESKPRNWRRPLDAMDAESVAMDEERAELQRAAQDTSRAPASSPVPIVFVFVDVEHFHSLLVREPAAMGRANDHYRRVVREAIIHHDCFEVRAVESMFLITCPSASAGVALVREMVERTEKLSKSDARALSTVYTALGCSPGGPAGLRLRLGMHRGAASFSSAGVVQCCGRAVDTAVCVAYSIVCPGQLLLTDPARYALINEGAKEVDELIVRGSRQLSLMTEEKMEMFELHLSPSTADGGEGSLGQEGAIQAARVLETGTEALHPTTVEICREQLVGHFDGIPDDLKMADLRSINQRLGLDVLHMEDYTDDNAYTEALLSAVADRIAAMVESRCGVVQLQKQRQHAASPHFRAGSPMGSLLISKPSSPALVSMGRPTLREAGSPTVRFDESVFRGSPTVGPSCGSPKFSSWRMQDHRRVSQDGGTRTLRHFAYSRDSSHTVDELLQRRATGSFTHRSSSSSGEEDS